MIQDKVLAKACDGEAKAFFVKMVGDYYRYIAENAKGGKLEEVKNKALAAYDEANQIALAPCNPIKLGLALNSSVFHYEVMKNHKAACDLADKALQEALDKIDELEEEDFRDAKSIIELLKENLTLWKEEEEDPDNNIDDLWTSYNYLLNSKTFESIPFYISSHQSHRFITCSEIKKPTAFLLYIFSKSSNYLEF